MGNISPIFGVKIPKIFELPPPSCDASWIVFHASRSRLDIPKGFLAVLNPKPAGGNTHETTNHLHPIFFHIDIQNSQN